MNILANAFLVLLSAATALAPVYAADALPRVLGGAVRSKEWIMRREKGEEEFKGDVSYKNSRYELRSDWALYNRNTEVFKTAGQTYGKKIWDDGAVTEVYSHSATYNHKEEAAWLYPKTPSEKVRVLHNDPKSGTWESYSNLAYLDQRAAYARLTGNVEIINVTQNQEPWTSFSQKAEFKNNQTLIYLEDGVRIKRGLTNAVGDTAVYNRAANILDLFGRPVVWGVQKEYEFAVQADTITAVSSFSDMTANGRVKGWIRNLAKDANHGAKLR